MAPRHNVDILSMGTPAQYPSRLDHLRVGTKIGPNRLLAGQIRAESAEKRPLFAMMIVAIANMIDGREPLYFVPCFFWRKVEGSLIGDILRMKGASASIGTLRSLTGDIGKCIGT
jgi:hypothetical protein